MTRFTTTLRTVALLGRAQLPTFGLAALPVLLMPVLSMASQPEA